MTATDALCIYCMFMRRQRPAQGTKGLRALLARRHRRTFASQRGKLAGERPSLLVRHQVPRGAVILRRRVVEEIGDPTGIEASVLLHLLSEAAVLVAFLEKQAPERVEAFLDVALERVGDLHRLAQGPANLVQPRL